MDVKHVHEDSIKKKQNNTKLYSIWSHIYIRTGKERMWWLWIAIYAVLQHACDMMTSQVFNAQ
jgi:hypothetical protein